MPALTWLFFGLFLLVMVGTYLALRRGIGSPRTVAALGLFAGVVTMALAQVARVGEGGNLLVVGAIGGLLGALGTIAVLALAWYFRRGAQPGTQG